MGKTQNHPTNTFSHFIPRPQHQQQSILTNATLVSFTKDISIIPCFFAQRIITMPQVIRGVRSNSEPNNNTGTPGSPRANETRRVTFDHGQDREESEAYYDSRAATQYEFQRRASTLQTCYCEHPELLPQLPFTFRHGFKRWRLGGYIALMVFDACVVPIMLYYAMTFGGHVEGSITFAVITAIWGGPTYVES